MRCLAGFFIGLATMSCLNVLCFSIWISFHRVTVVSRSTSRNQSHPRTDGAFSRTDPTRRQSVTSTHDQTRRKIDASFSRAKQTRPPTPGDFSASNQTRQTAHRNSTPKGTPTPVRQTIIGRWSVFNATRHYKSLKDSRRISLRCSSCAVVSSSGTLLGEGAGKEIDNHSCVIRMNMAPVEGYEHDVGRRTSLRMMNFFMFNATSDRLPPGSQVLVWGLFKRKSHLENAMHLMANLSAGSAIYGQTEAGEMEANALFENETGHPLGKTNSWLSTGWFTLMVAIEICRKTHVYGMVPSNYCMMNATKDAPYHYYDNPWQKQCATYKTAETNRDGAHRFMTEKAVFANWARKYPLSFHHPKWNRDGENRTKIHDTPFVRHFRRKDPTPTKRTR